MWRQAADWAVDAGAEVFEVSLPHTWMGLPCYYAIANAETASNLAKYDGLRYGTKSHISTICCVLISLAHIHVCCRSQGSWCGSLH